MKELRLYPRYRHLTRRAATAPRVVTGTPGSLARIVHSLSREVDGAVWLVADRNTAAAAPEIVDALPESRATILPGTPHVVPAIELADRIADEASRAGSRALVVIGGGTLTDLGKYAARVAGMDLISVPSAASVDAYNSARSALRIDGYHRTPDARVPTAILASPEIIAAAPSELSLAGLGDLIAKLIARLDWELASIVTGEPFSLRDSEWSARAARHALARLRHAGLEEASFTALDALLVTGHTMRVCGSSRPAASSEHTIAHLWEVALGDEHESLHGLLVVRASQYVVRAYEWILARLERGSAPTASWPREAEAGWHDRVPADMTPFIGKMEEESAGRTVDDTTVAARRERIDQNRDAIVALARTTLSDARRGLDALDAAGIESVLPDMPAHWVARGLQWVKYLRNRYSMFDLAFELGWEQELLEHLGAGEPADSPSPTRTASR